MKQITMKIVGFVTFTTEKETVDLNDIPVNINVDENSNVSEIIEAEVIYRTEVGKTDISKKPDDE
ncbi:MAG: hypothetical protein ACTSQA_06020 [Candidatus Heimdallarchaeaceae archaeon]